LVPLAVALPTIPSYRAWASWDYSGLEAKPAWPELNRVVGVVEAAPAGRVYWEHDWQRLAPFGSVNVLTLLPYWSPSHPALRGLWQQSSTLVPALDRLDAQILEAAATGDTALRSARWRAAVGELEGLGVSYFITTREGSAAALTQVPRVRLLVAGPRLTLFALPEPELVRRENSEGGISDVVISEQTIRFHTGSPGQPHLVAVPFFPNWRALAGARPPRAGRDGLIEVVPTGPDVVLEYRAGWPERLGGLISGAGILGGLIVLALRRRRMARTGADGVFG
jgi:hypothetical protein